MAWFDILDINLVREMTKEEINEALGNAVYHLEEATFELEGPSNNDRELAMKIKRIQHLIRELESEYLNG